MINKRAKSFWHFPAAVGANVEWEKKKVIFSLFFALLQNIISYTSKLRIEWAYEMVVYIKVINWLHEIVFMTHNQCELIIENELTCFEFCEETKWLNNLREFQKLHLVSRCHDNERENISIWFILWKKSAIKRVKQWRWFSSNKNSAHSLCRELFLVTM